MGKEEERKKTKRILLEMEGERDKIHKIFHELRQTDRQLWTINRVHIRQTDTRSRQR